MRKLLSTVATATLVAGLAAGGTVTSSKAQEIVIGLGAAVTSLDPHYHALGPNNNIADHIFGSLIHQDEKQRLRPGLAESWKPIAEDTWEVKLRRGVKFHDGSEFDAKDVVSTFKRIPWVPNSPSAFTIYTKPVIGIEVKDPFTLHLRTNGPYPLLPNDLSNFFIVPAKFETTATEDFNKGTAAVGSGPFKLVEYVRGDRIVLERNESYWGPKPHWKKVTFKLILNAPARVAALLAGDVQMIENVPTADIAKLKTNANLELAQAVSNRLIYLHMDHDRDQTPFATDKSGTSLGKNPFKDLRVRRALSMAINREAIAERVMEGVAIPAGQFLADGFFGISPNLKPVRYDPDGAKKLLAEAGYANGFGMTLHASNDRYINDSRIIQTVGQMFSRIGVEAKVEVMPWASYATRATNREFSMFLVGWGSGTGETSSPLRSLVSTFDRDRGLGQANRGRYSNKEMDATLAEALKTVDEEKRGILLAKASEIAINDVGVIPIHFEISTWALKKGLSYTGRAGQETHAHGVVPK
jgi:peptide/nickel transport system substrate-binding protein